MLDWDGPTITRSPEPAQLMFDNYAGLGGVTQPWQAADAHDVRVSWCGRQVRAIEPALGGVVGRNQRG